MTIVYQGKTKTGKDLVIRYPEMSDLEELLNYINTLSDEKTFIRYQGEHETLESEQKFLKKRLKEIKDKKVIHLLAFCDGRLAGGSDIHMMDRTEKHIGLFGITISKDSRGDGIGKILMDRTIKEAIEVIPGLKIITLEVFSSNKIAIDLYKKMGFEIYGKLPDGTCRQDKFEDAIFMYAPVERLSKDLQN